MNMTPKKILSLPVYGSGTTLGLIAAILLLPGGLIMAFAFGCYWLADKLSEEQDDECDLTVKEVDGNGKTCDNCLWVDVCTIGLVGIACEDWEKDFANED